MKELFDQYKLLINECEKEIALREFEKLRHEQRGEFVLASNCMQRILELMDRKKDFQLQLNSIETSMKPINIKNNLETNNNAKSLKNPYFYGKVIREDIEFYNRTILVEELTLLSTGAYYLKGNRRIGKTSLLRQVERKLLTEPKTFPIYLNLEGASSAEDFREYFLRAVKEACRNLQITGFEEADSFLDCFTKSIEHCRDLGLHCFLLIDEAEMLLHFSDELLAQFHRELIDSHSNLTVVICATTLLQELYFRPLKNGGIFLDNFHPKQIGCFTKDDAVRLICQIQNPTGTVNVSPNIIDSILKHTGTHPYLIQRVCYSLFENGALKPLNASDLNLDINLRSFFEIDFRSLTPLHQQILLQFFWEHPLQAKDLKGPSKAIIQEALNELEQLGFLSKNDGAYSLGNYFLAQWLDEKRAEGFTHEDIPETKRTGSKKLNVFISYAQEDAAYMVALNKHLSVLKRSKKVATWSEYNILPGTDWDREIHQQIVNADLVLLLVSASFLSSDSIWNEQINIVMERHSQGESRVVPILIRDCVWEETPFGNIQGLPRSNNPVGSTRNDNAWAEIVTELKALVDELSLH